MGILFVIVLVIVVIAVIINGNKSTVKKPQTSYQEDKILDQYLNNSSSVDSSLDKPSGSSLSRPVKPSTPEVNITKYHDSNKIVGSITIEYWKKWHEIEGPCSYINPRDADDYIMKYVIYIWNDVLEKEVTLKDTTLQGLVSQTESQFEKWSISVERKEKRKSSKEPTVRPAKKTYKNQSLVFEVKGLVYRDKSAIAASQNLKNGDVLYLEVEDNNIYDPFAMKVRTKSGVFIGYVDRRYSKQCFLRKNEVKEIVVDSISNNEIPFIEAKIEFE